MDAIQPETVLQFFRELGMQLPTPSSINVGGAIALILANKISRATEDVDVVDEVPADIRSRHALLESLAKRYGLHLTHFQSHFLRMAGGIAFIHLAALDSLKFSRRPDRYFCRQLFGGRRTWMICVR